MATAGHPHSNNPRLSDRRDTIRGWAATMIDSLQDMEHLHQGASECLQEGPRAEVEGLPDSCDRSRALEATPMRLAICTYLSIFDIVIDD